MSMHISTRYRLLLNATVIDILLQIYVFYVYRIKSAFMVNIELIARLRYNCYRARNTFIAYILLTFMVYKQTFHLIIWLKLNKRK